METALRIEKLLPPDISSESVVLMIQGTRPMRQDRFNISSEVFLDKEIFNCYGHGGSGWTTLFGSVEKTIQLFENLPDEKKSKPIRVIGSGCMGLLTAIELCRRGYNVTGITTKGIYDAVSWKAAGYFALVSIRCSDEERENLDNLGIETFQMFQKIDKGNHPYISRETVCFLPVYCSQETDSGLQKLEEKGLIPKKEEVILDFGNVSHSGFFKYMTYSMDSTLIMQQLHKEVKRLQIPITIQEIASFYEVEEEIVFNCSGYGAKELNNDEALIGVRGHLVLLNEKAGPEPMSYMIFSKFKTEDKEEYVCLFPRKNQITSENIHGVSCYGAIGVTYIPNVDNLSKEELKKLDEREYAKILDRNCQFYYGMSFKEKNAKSTRAL